MTATQTHPEQTLKSSLEKFETCLLTPVMSGELVAWVDELCSAWSQLAEQVNQHVSEVHPRQYKQICNEDPELLPRTEKLREEDSCLEEECGTFDRFFHRFAEHAPKFEPDEEKIASHVKTLIDEGVEFITRVRKQDAAVQAWFVETFTRDRGVAD